MLQNKVDKFLTGKYGNINPYLHKHNEIPENENSEQNNIEKDFYTSYEVATMTNYTVPTINKWAQKFNLYKDPNGFYHWHQADINKFRTMKRFNKDSYHIHYDKIVYGKTILAQKLDSILLC